MHFPMNPHTAHNAITLLAVGLLLLSHSHAHIAIGLVAVDFRRNATETIKIVVVSWRILFVCSGERQTSEIGAQTMTTNEADAFVLWVFSRFRFSIQQVKLMKWQDFVNAVEIGGVSTSSSSPVAGSIEFHGNREKCVRDLCTWSAFV